MAENVKTRKTKKDYLLEILEYGTEEQKNTLEKLIEEYKTNRTKKINEQKQIIKKAKKVLKDLGYTKDEDSDEVTSE